MSILHGEDEKWRRLSFEGERVERGFRVFGEQCGS